MYETLEDRLRRLGDTLPEPSDAHTESARRLLLQTAAQTGRARRTHGRRYFRPGLVAVCAAAALGAAIPLSHAYFRSPTHRSSVRLLNPSRFAGPRFSVSQPLHDASVVTLSQAAADLGSALPLPSTQLAGSSTLGQVTQAQDLNEDGSTSDTVAVSYPASNLVVEYQNPAPYSDAATAYQAYVDQTPATLAGLASVGNVDGYPALILELNKGATGDNPASVEFVIGKIRIAVIGYQPSKSLLPIAESIAAAADSTS